MNDIFNRGRAAKKGEGGEKGKEVGVTNDGGRSSINGKPKEDREKDHGGKFDVIQLSLESRIIPHTSLHCTTGNEPKEKTDNLDDNSTTICGSDKRGKFNISY